MGEGLRGRGLASVLATTLHVAASGASKYEATRRTVSNAALRRLTNHHNAILAHSR